MNSDAIVIGSSPMSMIMAINLSLKGENVALVEMNKEVGGAWKAPVVKNVGRHEMSCHLIEPHSRRVYRMLERYSGIPFVPCVPQPIKMYNDGSVVRYSTQLSRVSAAASAWVVAFALVFIGILNPILPFRFTIKRGKNHKKTVAFRSAILKTTSLLEMMPFSGVMFPSIGYAGFIHALRERAVNSGVKILQGKVDRVELTGGGVSLGLSAEGMQLRCRKVYIPESVDFRNANVDGNLLRLSNVQFTDYWHVLIGIRASGPNRKFPPYIHFPENELLHRMTISRDGRGGILVLIQLRSKGNFNKEVEAKAKWALLRIGVIRMRDEVTVLDQFSESFISSRSDAHVTAMEHELICVFHSIGDLSRCVMENKYLRTWPRYCGK